MFLIAISQGNGFRLSKKATLMFRKLPDFFVNWPDSRGLSLLFDKF